ncbi:MAG: SCO family protein [Sulfuriflexus sp.]|nr:SCO family protein [Sulfuriflexus sp.]
MTPKASPIGILILSLSVVALFAAIYISQRTTPQTIPQELMAVLRPPSAIKPFTGITNQHSQAFVKDDFKEKWSFVFFGYTFCPDVCPTTLTTLKQIDDILKKDYPASANTQVVFVSVDPERDSLEILKKYTAYFNPEFTAVTGTEDDLLNFSRQFSAAYVKEPAEEGSDYLISHTSSIFLVNPEMKIVASFSPPLDVETITSQYLQIHMMSDKR